MKCSRFRLDIAGILGGACLATAALETFAQAYPTRPVRMVIPTAAREDSPWRSC